MDIDATLFVPGATAEVVGNLFLKLRAVYIFPDVAAKLCESLQKHLENGDYADLKEGELLALALTI